MKQLILSAYIKLSNEIGLMDVDVQAGLNKAKEDWLNQIKPIMNTIVLPIIDIILIIMLVFQIASAAAKNKQGQEWSDKIIPIAVNASILIIVGGAHIWLWSMAGM